MSKTKGKIKETWDPPKNVFCGKVKRQTRVPNTAQQGGGYFVKKENEGGTVSVKPVVTWTLNGM